jgi:ATP-dependent helicase Lhr and Lhr-like helicase
VLRDELLGARRADAEPLHEHGQQRAHLHVAETGEVVEAPLELLAVGGLRPQTGSVAVVALLDRRAELLRPLGHRRREAVERRPAPERLLELRRIHVRGRRGVECPAPPPELERRRERPLERHLLVEREPDEQRERLLDEEAICLLVAREAEAVGGGHGVECSARYPSGVDSLGPFSPAVREWFLETFDGPTPAQEQGWPAIASGAHTLIQAPTGSGKTLAAFLWALDRARPGEGMQVLYVSPLKALNYDVERNLRGPLAGIGLDLRVGVRTGDTPQKERAELRKHPPEILITTPESLFLMLTSQVRETLESICVVIVDEVHAMAATKRGAHLALSLERLVRLTGEPLQRVGLSATQRPLEEIARFVSGGRPIEVIDSGRSKELDLEVVVPLDDMREPGEGNSIWPSIYPALLELVQAHRSTILFVNNRRLAERLALRLNELAAKPIARAHHGSLAREQRVEIEELLKKGEIPCLVATSSLELGVDMGAVDLVIQVESPKSVARGLQRIGRAGHTLDAVSKGRIFPKFRGDLLESAVVARRIREGAIEETVVPRKPLDVLAQQIVAICADEELSVDELHELVRGAWNFRDLSRAALESVLDMLSGRYPSEEFAELRPRIVWDRVAGVVRGRQGARQLAVTNAGTIPDRGLFGVFLAGGGGRVGELDEEMVYEAREGQTFLLGATTWRIEEITRDRVLVSPAPGIPGAIPFWKGEGSGRPYELGEAIGRAGRELVALPDEQAAKRLRAEYALDERAAQNLVTYLREQEQATGALPSDRTIVVERFRDEIGDWRLCILTPFGGRVHAPWSLALAARLRESVGLEVNAIWSDDGIALHLPDAESPPPTDDVLVDPDEVEDLVVSELAGSALFGSRFRENAGRALLIPRRRPGQRTPLWQQRLKAQGLLQVARRYADFPVVLETYRECLKDVFDLPALRRLLSDLRQRKVDVVDVETASASPFASSLLFDYIATYMYEDDTPMAERRAQALALDRDLLRELLGAEELRDLLDPDALGEVEAELRGRARTPDELHDLLLRRGELAPGEFDDALAGELERERRAVRVRIGGATRLIAAEDAGRYRDAVGAMPPGGLPDTFLESGEDPLGFLLVRFARGRGPFTTHEAAERLGLDPDRAEDALAALERGGRLVRGELRPGGVEREWCDPDVLRRLRRVTLAKLRKEVEPADQSALARFLPSWQGVDRRASLREALVPLQGVSLPVGLWESDVLPRRVPRFEAAQLDQLCASGEVVWVGAGLERVALFFREDAPLLGRPGALPTPEGEAAERLRAALGATALFWYDLLDASGLEAEVALPALWELVWAGEVSNDAWQPLRAGRRYMAPRPVDRQARRRFSRQRSDAVTATQGRWSLTRGLFPGEPDPRALAELLLERHGIVTRDGVRAEGVAGGYAPVYHELRKLETLGVCRRGYFVEGLGGAQFALPGAVERLREKPEEEAALVLAAADPAQPYGAALPWPKRAGGRASRVAGAYVVTLDGAATLFVERGGRSLVPLREPDESWLRPAFGALVGHVRRAGLKRLAVERFDGQPVFETDAMELLVAAGFLAGPKRAVLRS